MPHGGIGPHTGDGAPLAGMGRRFAARLIDYVSLTVLFFLFFLATVVVTVIARPDVDDPSDAFYNVLVGLLFFGWGVTFFFYDWLCHIAWGRTIGKALTGIKVVREVDGGRLTQAQAAGRAAIFGIPQSVVCLGHIFTLMDCLAPLADPSGRALHDRASRTVVIRG